MPVLWNCITQPTSGQLAHVGVVGVVDDVVVGVVAEVVVVGVVGVLGPLVGGPPHAHSHSSEKVSPHGLIG